MKILAIDIGGSKIMVGAVTVKTPHHARAEYQLGHVLHAKLPAEVGESGILETLFQLCDAIFAHDPLHTFDRVGTTIPGLADDRVWIYSPFSGIQNFPIVAALEERWGRGAVVENDVNACAIAEGVFGRCHGVRDFIWLTISNGIGGGVVLNGDIYRGALGFSGEFGHLCVVEDGQLCGCGKRGCLEAECAGPGISRFFQQLTRRSDLVEAGDIAEMARNGDPDACRTFARTGRLLGVALANAANILNPSKIIIGGGVAGAWDLFSPAMTEHFRKNIFLRANAHVTIDPTALGYAAALLGATAIALR